MSDTTGWPESASSEAILRHSRRRIELFEAAGDDWRFAESLKSISEDAAQEYEGRALFELIQNGYDALGESERGRVLVLLDSGVGEHGALYVANEGAPFTERNFKAITEFGLSDKAAGEGIGNKGLGFRSVLQLTDWPEIYSKAERATSAFDGYCFRFATADDIRNLVADDELVRQVIAKVSPLALPVPAALDDPILIELAASYSTVVRLPLRNERASQAAREQIDAITKYDAPILLFLTRLVALEVRTRSGEADDSLVLPRDQGAFEALAADDWISEVDLGDEGRYLCGVRAVDPTTMAAAIDSSISAREIDEKWREWDGSAEVAIALRLDAPLASGRLYTFLPMSSSSVSPLPAHVHAPFFTKLARLDISESVALNSALLDEVAVLAKDLISRLKTARDNSDLVGMTVDTACWDPPDRLESAFRAAGSELADEALVPVLGKTRWASLNEAYQWSVPGLNVMTATAVAGIGVRVVDPRIGTVRLGRLENLHVAVNERSMEPLPEEAAPWAEKLAAKLSTAGTASLERWADFYDDLSIAFGKTSEALRGLSIVLDQDSRVVRSLGAPDDEKASHQKVFFAPDDASDEDDSSRVPRDLRALRRRITFTHPGIPWNVAGNPPRRRPGRTFLENAQLVREYRTDRVFDALEELLRTSHTEAFRRDALLFAYRQYGAFNDSQRQQLVRRGFYVPLRDGTWRRASEALFSPVWATDGARRVEQFLNSGGDAISEFAHLRDRWIAPCNDWPAGVDSVENWKSFLSSLGVRDGLLLFVLPAMQERDGINLRPELVATHLKLDPELAEAWPLLVRVTSTEVAHPWTKYAFDNRLAHLPGASEVVTLNAQARHEFAELLLLGLASWPSHVFSVEIKRPGRPVMQQDRKQWPTPFAAQLWSLRWMPVSDDNASDGLRFVTPTEAWFAADGELPAFMPAIPTATRRLLTEAHTLQRVKNAGLRVWEDSRHGADLLRDFGELLEKGSVPGHLSVHFKKHYQRGWADAARLSMWPWAADSEPRLAVMEASTLESIVPTSDTRLYIPNEDDPLKETLLELAGYPILIAPIDDGEAVARLFEANGISITRFSDADVRIYADGELVQPSEDLPLLADGVNWLLTLIGLVIELKSGEFRRRTERAVRDMINRLRATRIVRAEDIEILIDGTPAGHPPTTRSLPVDDDHFPAIVVWACERGWDEWEAATPAVCQLLGQPSLQPALELSLVKLQARLGDEHPDELSDEDYAHALDAPSHKIAELRRGLTGETIELIRRLRPVLVCLLGTERTDEINRAFVRSASNESVIATVRRWQSDLPCDTETIVGAAQRTAVLGDLRDALSLDFATFNRALRELGAPYNPITHPDLHEHVFQEFVEANITAIIERLRERYSIEAQSSQDISKYVEGRRLEGLSPNPRWLSEFKTPSIEVMRSEVMLWLETHGAEPDLESLATLPDLHDLRAKNFERLADLVGFTLQRVAAWCRLRGQAPPPNWVGPAVMTAQGQLEGLGTADLLELSHVALSAHLIAALGWPAGMPLTTDIDLLGLTEEDLIARNGGGGAGTQPERPRPTITVGDVALPVGSEYLAELARVAFETIDDRFLAQSGKSVLGDTPAIKRRSPGGTSRIVVARATRMTDDQRTAIGLVGEVAARAWLERKYQNVRWRSGYAAIVSGDDEASDSWGYDFEVPHRNSSLLIEVKALVDEPRDLIEFEMGDSEVRAAQECAGGDRYRILLVTSVLEPAVRRIHNLPSPFSRKGSGHFRVIGRGLRYQCALPPA